MRTGTMLAAIAAVGLAAAPAAHADWHHHWRDHGEYYHHDDDGGGVAAGALIGLGVGALIGGAIAASQQPYYAPPPVAYAPPPGVLPRASLCTAARLLIREVGAVDSCVMPGLSPGTHEFAACPRKELRGASRSLSSGGPSARPLGRP